MRSTAFGVSPPRARLHSTQGASTGGFTQCLLEGGATPRLRGGRGRGPAGREICVPIRAFRVMDRVNAPARSRRPRSKEPPEPGHGGRVLHLAPRRSCPPCSESWPRRERRWCWSSRSSRSGKGPGWKGGRGAGSRESIRQVLERVSGVVYECGLRPRPRSHRLAAGGPQGQSRVLPPPPRKRQGSPASPGAIRRRRLPPRGVADLEAHRHRGQDGPARRRATVLPLSSSTGAVRTGSTPVLEETAGLCPATLAPRRGDQARAPGAGGPPARPRGRRDVALHGATGGRSQRAHSRRESRGTGLPHRAHPAASSFRRWRPCCGTSSLVEER